MDMEGAANKLKRIRRKGGFADYTFAFNESTFSDRTLHIVTNIETQEDDDGNGAIEVGTVQVNSAILAESSQFFKKLFSSGMRETEQRHATVHISPSEEQAFMYLLKFMYGGKIETQSTKELLDVLMLADKFAVASCILGCTNALDSMPMTMEFASLTLCLPSTLLTTNVMQPIVKAAKGFLLTKFSKRKFVEEYTNLPLHIIEEVLQSDELHASSEDYIYDFATKWAKRHYHDQDERRQVFQNKLIKLIRFPQMTDYKLAEIHSNEDMDSANALKLVSEALNYKGGSSSQNYDSEDKRFCKRFYELRPIRAIEFHTPKREYRVFCDFNIDKSQSSQIFYMWGEKYSLSFSCASSSVFSWILSSISFGKLPVEYVVFLRSKLSNDFCEVSRGKVSGNEKNCVILLSKTKTQDYNLNNVIHMEAVFR